MHVGTSGWNYKDWKGPFYPETIGERRFLEYYATQFDCTELNASFYRLPQEKTVNKWRERTPEDFRFCPKLSRYITHQKRLKAAEEPVKTFFDRFELLRDRLGPVLIQLPGNLPFDPDRARAFLRHLTEYPERFALEARHESWLEAEALAALREHNVAWVIAHSGGPFPYGEEVTADIVYLRFHGPGARYASTYSEEMLEAYASKIVGWLDAGLEVWAFFNNTDGGYAPNDARDLADMVDSLFDG